MMRTWVKEVVRGLLEPILLGQAKIAESVAGLERSEQKRQFQDEQRLKDERAAAERLHRVESEVHTIVERAARLEGKMDVVLAKLGSTTIQNHVTGATALGSVGDEARIGQHVGDKNG